MKHPRILLVSLALNLVLVAVVIALRARLSVSLPAPVSGVASTILDRPVSDWHAGTADRPGLVSRPGRFHWGLVESADYRQYIANLRALGCPERLIRDIIIADVTELYASKMRAVNSVRQQWQPWHGSDRRQAHNRERSARVNALQAEQQALLKELLGIEWSEQWDDLTHENGTLALALGFLAGPKPAQLFAMIEDFSEATREVNEKVRGILLEEDRDELARLRQALMTKFSALMTPAEFEELSLRAQSLGKFMEGDIHLEGVALSGPEFRQLCGLSRLTGDVIQDDLLRDGKDWSEEEEERQKAAFEAEVKKLLGPARFADFQRAQQSEFQEAFEFTEEHHLPVSTAAKISDALRHASEQSEAIKHNQALSPEEQAAALVVLQGVTVNALSSALGAKYAEFKEAKGTDLDDLFQAPSVEPEGPP